MSLNEKGGRLKIAPQALSKVVEDPALIRQRNPYVVTTNM